MPRQEKIRAQTTPEDGPLLETGFGNSLYRPQPHMSFSDHVREKVNLEHADQVTGRKLIFDIEKQATMLEDLNLRVVFPALAVPGDGTYIRYADFPLWQLVEKITIKYTSNTLAEYDPDILFSDHRFKSNEHQECTEAYANGGLTAAQRNTLATAPQTVRMRVPTPWFNKACHNPIISALANKIRVEFQLRQARDIIQTDGTKPATITLSGIRLEQQFIHVTGADRAEATSLTLRPDGLSYLYKEQQSVHKVIPAGALGPANDFVIELNDFDGPITCITGMLRTSEQLDGTSPDPAHYEIDTTLLNGLTYRMTSNGISLFEETEADRELPYTVQKYFGSGPGIEQILFYWDELPQAENVASGHISIGNFSNPKIFLRSAVANAEELTLTLIARRFNWLNAQAGNIQLIWN